MARFIRLSFSSEKTGFAGRAAEKYSPTRPTGGKAPKTKGSIMEFENQIEPVIQETTDLIEFTNKIEDSREKPKNVYHLMMKNLISLSEISLLIASLNYT